MPYKSKAQQGFFHANVGKKGITKSMVSEYDSASKGMKLPKRTHVKITIHKQGRGR